MLSFERKRSILVKLAQDPTDVKFARGSTVYGGKTPALPPRGQKVLSAVKNVAAKVKNTGTAPIPKLKVPAPVAGRGVAPPPQVVGKSLSGGPIPTRGGASYKSPQGNMLADKKEVSIPPTQRSGADLVFKPRDMGPANPTSLKAARPERGRGQGQVPFLWNQQAKKPLPVPKAPLAAK